MIFREKTKPDLAFASCIPFRECRAKTCPNGTYGTSVFDHCRYAGYVAEGLLGLLPAPVRTLLPPETPFLVSLHDIGKVSPGFEGKYFIELLREKAPTFAEGFINGGYVTNHASIGAKALLRLFGLTAGHPIVRAVAAHHGFAPDRLDFTQDGLWQDERAALVRALAAEFGVAPESPEWRLPDVACREGAHIRAERGCAILFSLPFGMRRGWRR